MSNGDIDHWDDLHKFVLGEQIGKGRTRTVFLLTSPEKSTGQVAEYVVKVAHQYEACGTSAGVDDNIAEYHLYKEAQMAEREDILRWLAPCIRISHCGRYLVQRRTVPIELSDMPKQLPAWMVDVKLNNFGRLVSLGKDEHESLVVMHDYGLNNAFKLVATEMVDTKVVVNPFVDPEDLETPLLVEQEDE